MCENIERKLTLADIANPCKPVRLSFVGPFPEKDGIFPTQLPYTSENPEGLPLSLTSPT